MSETLKLIVAAFGGLATGAGVAWKVFMFRYQRRAHVDVSISAGMLAFGPELSDPKIIVTAVNSDTTPIDIISVWLDHPDGTGETAIVPFQPPGSTMPGTIAGRGKGETWFDIRELEVGGFPVANRGLVAAVRTAAGEEIRSKPKVCWSA